MRNKCQRNRKLSNYEEHKKIYILMAEAGIYDLKLLNPVCFYYGRVRRIILVNEKIHPFPKYCYKRYISSKDILRHKYLFFLRASTPMFELDRSIKNKHECDASYESLLRVVKKSIKHQQRSR